MTASSIGVLLKAGGWRVTVSKSTLTSISMPVLCRPLSTVRCLCWAISGEAGLDLGNYERFVD